MKPAPSDDLRRLHFLNTLFARLTGDDLYLARQLQEAIAFSLADFEAQTREHPEYAARYDAAFNAAAARLLAGFFAAEPEHAFFHWDALASAAPGGALFARAEIMAGLKRLAARRQATLLITNLRPAFLPPAHRATARRERDYAEALDFVRSLVAARARPDADLRLLFL
jgi:hypothetical protein